MIFDFKVSIRSLTCLVWLGVFVSLNAQEAMPTPAKNTQEGTTHVRTWAVLGDLSTTDTFTLSREPEKPKEGNTQTVVFANLKGCFRSGFGAGYEAIPSGNYRFVLRRGGGSSTIVDEVAVTLEKDAAYTLLAAMDNGRPKLRLVQEAPTTEEQDGIYLFNLLAEPPLFVQIGDSAPRPVPFSMTQPLVIRAAQAAYGPVTFTFLSKRKTEVRKQVAYPGKGRVSAVFMRTNSSKPSVFVYPSEPNTETTSDENSNDSQTN